MANLELPQDVAEFAHRCRQLLLRDGTKVSPGSRSLTTLDLMPLWIVGAGRADQQLLELYVSVPGPAATDPYGRVQIYKESGSGHVWDEWQCRCFLPMLRRRLVLEALSEIPADDG